MVKRLLFLIVILGICTANTIPAKLEKKINKTISAYFETEEFSKTLVTVSQDIQGDLPSDFSENLYKISSPSGALGYVYLGNAPSKTATFDYLVLFDNEFIIKTSKVLIYREEYGGEISSKRWLKQFNGKSVDTPTLKYMEDINAISGATISVRSMTTAINQLLESLSILQKAQEL